MHLFIVLVCEFTKKNLEFRVHSFEILEDCIFSYNIIGFLLIDFSIHLHIFLYFNNGIENEIVGFCDSGVDSYFLVMWEVIWPIELFTKSKGEIKFLNPNTLKF